MGKGSFRGAKFEKTYVFIFSNSEYQRFSQINRSISFISIVGLRERIRTKNKR